MKGYRYGGGILLMLALAGCGGLVGSQAAAVPLLASTSTPPPTATAVPPLPSPAVDDTAMRSDNQGAIAVEITPVDLGASGDTLVFNVVLDTHSVDLSMDLAAASALTTDTGRSVNALSWEAPKGGHHVVGTLTFPANIDGARVLSGASVLTLTITGLDAPTRTFAWDLSP
jgi:hypothetical protein